METLYPQSTWDESYAAAELRPAPPRDIVRRWMEPRLPACADGAACLEVGCFPGGYLAICGEHGYELNGIDLTPRVDADLPRWLAGLGYRVGRLVRGDFFAFDWGQRFDLVYSHGFIEHFEDWRPVVARHAELVKPGGRLILTVPNFAGAVQRWLHAALDDENLGRHHLPVMDPMLWADAIGPGFEILETAYFGRFDFWIGVQRRSLPRKLAFWSLRATLPSLRRLAPEGRRAWAPYCGLVARRKA
jgi:SAM-dependent methyltransferase